ncbi:hypothetical protein DIPPA_62773 [Diplonema papillatum]|nr:hypothetical protein DIPPA_62773 [Diplonema papillatum]
MSDSMPLLPGNNELVCGDMLRTNYRRCQTLTSNRPRVAHQNVDTFLMKGTIQGTSAPPAHLALDRRVLRFKAYFREGVHESAVESERARLCLFYYFLEDDTLSVVEPRQLNSGMNQGTLVKRHKILGVNKRPISFTDLHLGTDIPIYGKTFRIYDCDSFTREFCLQEGHDVGEPEHAPESTYATLQHRKLEANARREGHGGRTNLLCERTAAAGGSTATREEVMATTQFLQNDRKVLRFKAAWDELDNTGGERRFFDLYYFLADDCIEVVEKLGQNCGRYPFPSFVRRRKCPKNAPNTSNLTFQKAPNVEYYHSSDLYMGAELVVCGKKFVIHDCDAFTKEYLRDTHGRSVDELQPRDLTVPKKAVPKPEPPLHNGFGSEEDSLMSWKHLALKCPVKDIRKFTEGSNQTLKFSLQMQTTNTIDASRRFVLTYYLTDDTVSIFEAATRNSGVLGGRFLQRQRVKLGDGCYAKPTDFYVGASVTISHRGFQVTSTDEHTLVYMEQNSKDFAPSNINAIMTKLAAMLQSKRTGLKKAFDEADVQSSGISYTYFIDMLEALKLPLVEQEIITVIRYLNATGRSTVSYNDFAKMVTDNDGETEDCDWQDIYSRWNLGSADENQMTHNEHSRLNEVNDGRSAQAMLLFLQEYQKRRALFQQELRVICDFSQDGCIGEPEFKKVVLEKLGVRMSQSHINELCTKLFPARLRRAPYREMIRLIENTSSYPHSAKTIARIR